MKTILCAILLLCNVANADVTNVLVCYPDGTCELVTVYN